MATIKKRSKDTYAVVYYYMDENGKRKQKWETYHSYKDATNEEPKSKISRMPVRLFRHRSRMYGTFYMTSWKPMALNIGACLCTIAVQR